MVIQSVETSFGRCQDHLVCPSILKWNFLLMSLKASRNKRWNEMMISVLLFFSFPNKKGDEREGECHVLFVHRTCSCTCQRKKKNFRKPLLHEQRSTFSIVQHLLDFFYLRKLLGKSYNFCKMRFMSWFRTLAISKLIVLAFFCYYHLSPPPPHRIREMHRCVGALYLSCWGT